MSVCTHWVGLLLSPESCLQPASSSVTHRRAGDCVGLICGCFQPASSSVTHRAAGPARPQSRFAASFAAAFNQSNPPSLTGQRITSGPLSESMLACTHCPPPSLTGPRGRATVTIGLLLPPGLLLSESLTGPRHRAALSVGSASSVSVCASGCPCAPNQPLSLSLTRPRSWATRSVGLHPLCRPGSSASLSEQPFLVVHRTEGQGSPLIMGLSSLCQLSPTVPVVSACQNPLLFMPLNGQPRHGSYRHGRQRRVALAGSCAGDSVQTASSDRQGSASCQHGYEHLLQKQS